MAKPAPPSGTPEEFPQTTPRNLYDTSDIRFVMRETAALAERVDHLKTAIEKLGPSFEKALDKHAAEMKERLTELKTDHKATSDRVGEIEKKVSFVKGAMWVLGGLFVVGLAILGAMAKGWIGAAPPPH